MKKTIIGLAVVITLVAAGLGFVYWQELRGVWPAVLQPSELITDVIQNEHESTGERVMQGPLSLPQGFKLEVFADNLPGARVMVRDSFGNFWVSQPNQGTITQLQVEDGVVTGQHVVFRGLNRPHGLAMDPESEFMMYIAEEDKVSRVPLYSDGSIEKIADLPTGGGGHFTRTIGVGPDNRLYISIGSSCNVCREDDPRRAAIISMNKDGSDIQTVATGLRNSVFFDWSPVDGRLWATDNGRDRIGDNIPPDEINIIQPGGFYGWPYCYGKKVHDTTFDDSNAAREMCRTSIGSHIDIQAHSAALGLAFIPEEGWPEDYWYDLIVAYHGSWNRSEPTGYKLVRHKLDANGMYQGAEDFVTGWLQGNEALGRPVDVHTEPGGVMYVSDDKAGVIYRITYTNS